MKKVIFVFFGMVLMVFAGCGGEDSGGDSSNPMPSVNLQAGEPVNSIQEFETRLESIYRRFH